MSQFCTSCGKPIPAGSGFCPQCGARQPAAAPPAAVAAAPPAPAPAARPAPTPVVYPTPTPAAMAPVAPSAVAPPAPAPKQGSSALKIVFIVLGVIVFFTVAGVGSCVYVAYRVRQKAEQNQAFQQLSAAMKAAKTPSASSTTPASGLPYLSDAMSKMADCIRKPTSSFHLSFKKTGSDGNSSSLEADVSPQGMTGEQTDVSPKSQMDGMEVGGTKVYPKNVEVSSPQDWLMTVGGIEQSYLNGMDIRDAQAGMKYVADEPAGGYNARHYDFDLANVPASEKAGTLLGAKWLGGVVNNATGGKGATLKDFNIKGSAWIAKDDGRMVKFQYDCISIFTDGSQKVTHHEGTVTRK